MFNLFQLQFIQATLVGLVSLVLIFNLFRHYRSKKNSSRVEVGVIDPSEVNQELIKDENDLRFRLSELSSMSDRGINHKNNILKARAEYASKLEDINNDRESLLY